jgi:hypothetical protein
MILLTEIQSIEENEYKILIRNLEKSNMTFGGVDVIPEWLVPYLATFENGAVPSLAACFHILHVNDDMK